MFLANGTAWFYSQYGSRAWQYLKPSLTRLSELGFADIDNDETTDVIYRRPDNGELGYYKGGRGSLRSLGSSSPMPMKDHRFGDFDGDALTDIFYTSGKSWHVRSGRTRAWSEVNTSSRKIEELLFGEFDTVRGTDVAAVTNSGWSYSSSARTGWTKLNGKLTKSFKNAVAADFNGNGRTDIAFNDGESWRWSVDGVAGLTTIAKNFPSIKKVVIGRFDGTARAQALRFKPFRPWLEIWSGIGTGSKFTTRSPQSMR